MDACDALVSELRARMSQRRDSHSRACAEDRRADAHHRRAFRDRRLEVGRHAHRQRIERRGPPRGQRVAATRAAARNCARCSAGVGRRLGDAHEPAQPQPRQPRDVASRARAVLAGATPLFVASPLTLTWMQHVERRRLGGPRGRQALRDLHADRRSAPSRTCSAAGARLVALERPDEVPLDVGEVARAPRSWPPPSCT